MKKLILAVSLTVAGFSIQAAELTAKEKAIIMKAVKDQLKDPESAKFRWMPLPAKINQKHFVDSYCGLVNAKNSYGGYTGFDPFEAQVARTDDGKFEVISVTVSNGNLTASDIAKMCSTTGYTDFASAK